jgi:GDP-4-dehydro-6-deoxy-D-mannose reductase
MPSRRALITGVNGFSGRYLVERLRREAGWEIFGLDTQPGANGPLDGYFCCDLTAANAVDQAVCQARPEVVFHLAGLIGAQSAERMWEVNVGGFTVLCDALRRWGRQMAATIRLLSIGSAAEIGLVEPSQLPVTEEIPCQPTGGYGRSKLEVTRRALAEPAEGPLAITVARVFNLAGPGLSRELALGNFARQIAQIVHGRAQSVRCGRLDARRDYVDVRDAVEAYVGLVERGRNGQIYNVCAGRSHAMSDLLRTMIDLSGVPVEVIADISAAGAAHLPDIYGDRTKIAGEIGWAPRISIEQSLADLLAHAVGREAGGRWTADGGR